MIAFQKMHQNYQLILQRKTYVFGYIFYEIILCQLKIS